MRNDKAADTRDKTEDELLDEELAGLEREERDRQASVQLDAKRRRAEELRLAKKLTGELGARGLDFQVINTDFGIFAVKTPDPLKAKIYTDRSGDDDGQGTERTHQFAASCLVFPGVEKFNAEASARHGIAVICARAALELAMLVERRQVGK